MKLVNCISALFLMLSTQVYALDDDHRQPMLLQAESAEFNNTTHYGVYKGNVSLDQGSTHLTANIAYTYANKKNQLTLAIAKGLKSNQAHYWSLPQGKKEILHAYADKIEYYPLKHQIKLLGNACVKQGKDKIQAPIIIYDTEKQHVISQSNKYGRTTITVNPQSNKHATTIT